MAFPGLADTPAAPAVEVSGWGRRFAAWIIDAILLAIVPTYIMVSRIITEMSAAGIFDAIEAGASQAAIQEEMNEVIFGNMGQFMAVSFVFAIISLAYYVLMHATLGKTLGKMALGIKVIKDDGSECDLAAAGKRAVVHPLGSGLPSVGFVVLLINGLWPLWDEKRQSLGDKLGKTYVVRA